MPVSYKMTTGHNWVHGLQVCWGISKFVLHTAALAPLVHLLMYTISTLLNLRIGNEDWHPQRICNHFGKLFDIIVYSLTFIYLWFKSYLWSKFHFQLYNFSFLCCTFTLLTDFCFFDDLFWKNVIWVDHCKSKRWHKYTSCCLCINWITCITNVNNRL